MIRVSTLAAILLAFVPVIAVAQKTTPAKPAAPKSKASVAPAADILPFRATEKTLANGLKVIVRIRG